MGLYLKKSFRAGPVRLNLSKSGLGLSAGVKGARVGCGPRGSYVHAGRNGLYYRKHLSTHPSASKPFRAHLSTSKPSCEESGCTGCGTLLLIMSAVLVIIWLFSNPAIFSIMMIIAVISFAIIGLIRHHQMQKIREYKAALDCAFVTSEFPPETTDISVVVQQRQALPKSAFVRRQMGLTETAVYQAVLGRILDDGFITQQEASAIAALDKIVGLDDSVRLQLKKDIFSAAYLEAIEDRVITTKEITSLGNLVAGLNIPEPEIKKELAVLSDLVDSQKLAVPLTPLEEKSLSVKIQKSESAFYKGAAKVLSKRKSKTSPTGCEYSVQRDGMMIITNKRLFITDEGSTNIRFSDIADIDIDMDNAMIQISKSTSSKPIYLETERPAYIGRIIDLLSKNPQ